MARLKSAVRNSRRKLVSQMATPPPPARAELLVRFHSLIAEATQVVYDLAGTTSNGNARKFAASPTPASAHDRIEITQDELFRSLIEARLNELGINQTLLAQRMGVTPPVVSRLLKRLSSMRPSTKAALAEALDCSLAELFKLRALTERDLIEAGL
ncbi:MAG: helix-turn-helix domain-containing protein [Phycisphaerae bacterium]